MDKSNMNKEKTFIGEVVEVYENGEALITIPDEVLLSMGWKDGDMLNMELSKDGTIIVTKVNK